MYTSYLKTPIGLLKITTNKKSLTTLDLAKNISKSKLALPALHKKIQKELLEYFKGSRKKFDVPVAFEGTAFQKSVWKKLTTIPYGKIVSYTGIAKAIGNVRAVRAVGTAIGKNPIPIIIPCHRVVASDGSMGGFSMGLHRKDWLLKREGGVK